MDYSLSEGSLGDNNGVSVRGMVTDIRAIPLPRISPEHSSGINAFFSVSPV